MKPQNDLMQSTHKPEFLIFDGNLISAVLSIIYRDRIYYLRVRKKDAQRARRPNISSDVIKAAKVRCLCLKYICIMIKSGVNMSTSLNIYL